MAKEEILEPEEKKSSKTEDAEIVDDFNPLDEPVIEKPYTRPNVRVNPDELRGDIPEPAFIAPQLSEPMIDDEKKKAQEPINHEMKDLPKKDKNDAAEKLAKMIMSGYKMANKFVDDSLQFNERKIAKLEREGQIDLNVEVPVSPSVTISAREFVQEYNQQSKDTITVSKEFEDDVMPVLTRVLAKRGAGLTDEQYLMYAVGKDVASKAFIVSQSLSAKKEILNMLKEITTGSPSVAPTSRPPSGGYNEPVNEEGSNYPKAEEIDENDEPEEEYVPQKQYDETNVNDFVNKMTGSMEEAPKEQKPRVRLLKNQSSGIGKRGRPKKK